MALKIFSKKGARNDKRPAAEGHRPFDSDAKYRIIDGIIFGAISLIFFLCPLFFTGVVAQGLGFEKMMLFYLLTLIGSVAWVTKGVISGELRITRTPLDIPVIASLVLVIISVAFSVSRKDSILGYYGSPVKSLAAVVVFILFYYLFINNINIPRLKKLFWVFSASAALISAFSLLQLNGIYILPLDFAKQINFNPLGSLSALTMGLVVMLPFLVVGAAQYRDIASKGDRQSAGMTAMQIFLGVVVLAALAVLFILNGFTYWPVAVITIVIVLMFYLSKVVPISNNNLVVPVGVFLFLIIFLVFGNINVFNKSLPAEVSLSRSTSFNIARQSIKSDPFFGSGLGTYYYIFTKYKQPEFNASPLWNVRFDSATVFWFELLSTVGVLGTLAIVIVVLTILSMLFIALLKTKENAARPILLASLSGLIASILLASMFSLNNSLLILMFLVGAFATAAAVTVYPERFSTLELSFRTSPKYALALAAVFLTVTAGVAVLLTMGVKLYLADIYAKRSLSAEKIEDKISYLEKAISLSPQQDTYYISLANQYMALANQTALSGGDQNSIQQYLNSAINNGKKSIEINPSSAADNEAVALIYENASFYTRGALEWAEKHYQEVMRLDPQSPTPYLRTALVNMARSNVETDPNEKNFYIQEAIKKYDESLAKKSDLAAAYYGKAIAEEKLNKMDDAIEHLKSAAVIAQGNIDYVFELGRLYFNRGVSKKPEIAQGASKQIAEDDITPEGQAPAGGERPDLSVNQNQQAGAKIARNDDLNNAEQLFLGILANNPSHANSLYSLALLYQKIDETTKSSEYVTKLLSVLTDENQKQAVRQQFEGLY